MALEFYIYMYIRGVTKILRPPLQLQIVKIMRIFRCRT